MTTSALTLKQVQKIRKNNRRKNKVVEQFLKIIEKLQSQLQALDQEQDAANEALVAALVKLDEDATMTVASLEKQIAEAKAAAKSAKSATQEEFGALISEAAEEAEAVRKVKSRLDALTA